MVSRRRHAFTLVEVLVVIVIISTIVALLIPAVLASRGRARVVRCTNNQAQLATAILGYETAKNRLPGYVNPIKTTSPAGTSAVTWAPLLLPFLSRNDLWEGTSGSAGWQTGQPSTSIQDTVVGLFLCPDQTRSRTYTLSYVVNIAMGNPPQIPTFDPATETGVFGNRVSVDGITTAIRNVSLADVPSTSQWPMFSESAFQAGSTSAAQRVWASYAHVDDSVSTKIRQSDLTTVTDPATPPTLSPLTSTQLGFVWQEQGKISAILPPIHPGIVIVTFCDGSVRPLSADTDCSVYYVSRTIP